VLALGDEPLGEDTATFFAVVVFVGFVADVFDAAVFVVTFGVVEDFVGDFGALVDLGGVALGDFGVVVDPSAVLADFVAVVFFCWCFSRGGAGFDRRFGNWVSCFN